MACRCDAGAISHPRQDGRAGMLRIAFNGTDVAALPQRPCALEVLRPLVSQPARRSCARVHELATVLDYLLLPWYFRGN